MKWIMVRPNHDRATEVTQGWGASLRELARGTAASLLRDLSGSEANATKLEECLSGQEVDFVAFYGHGNATSLLAGETAIVSVDGKDLTPATIAKRGRRVYAVACKAGDKLGPKLAENGCHFVGYKGNFYFSFRHEQEFGAIANAAALEWLTPTKKTKDIARKLRKDWDSLAAGIVKGGTPYDLNKAVLAEMNRANVIEHTP